MHENTYKFSFTFEIVYISQTKRQFVTLSAKMKPRIPAISCSKKITVRQIQNYEEHEEKDEKDEHRDLPDEDVALRGPCFWTPNSPSGEDRCFLAAIPRIHRR